MPVAGFGRRIPVSTLDGCIMPTLPSTDFSTSQAGWVILFVLLALAAALPGLLSWGLCARRRRLLRMWPVLGAWFALTMLGGYLLHRVQWEVGFDDGLVVLANICPGVYAVSCLISTAVGAAVEKRVGFAVFLALAQVVAVLVVLALLWYFAFLLE